MKGRFGKTLAGLLALLMALHLCGCSSRGDESTAQTEEDGGEFALSEAVYPAMSDYPVTEDYVGADGGFDDAAYEEAYEAWATDCAALQADLPEGYDEGLTGFTAATMAEFLTTDKEENLVYSPLNVYLALSMLAEVTDGNSRTQLLELLGTDSVETLRTCASALWRANYRDDGVVTTLLANSIWLNQSVETVPATLETLSECYYASAYQGEMGSDALNRALQQWLNEQTGGLLEEQAGEIAMEPETVLALASTLYYKAAWSDAFDASANTEGVFHGLSGDTDCTFMNESADRTWYWGEGFSAVCRSFSESGAMWLFLPDEGTTVNDLLTSGQAAELVSDPGAWENCKEATVHLSLPKFDVVSSYDLCDGLRELGITDVFDNEVSDFTPLTTDVEGLSVTQALHAARVTVDEDGCEAAAFTS